MAARTVKLDLADSNGRIEVDGQRLTGVHGIHIDGRYGHTPRVTLDLLVHNIEGTIEAEVIVPDRTAQTLIALGWTPPEGQP